MVVLIADARGDVKQKTADDTAGKAVNRFTNTTGFRRGHGVAEESTKTSGYSRSPDV
jgi:hypothetical protein